MKGQWGTARFSSGRLLEWMKTPLHLYRLYIGWSFSETCTQPLSSVKLQEKKRRPTREKPPASNSGCKTHLLEIDIYIGRTIRAGYRKEEARQENKGPHISVQQRPSVWQLWKRERERDGGRGKRRRIQTSEKEKKRGGLTLPAL